MDKPKIKDYYITKEDGTTQFDEDKYEKDLQSYLDDERRKASATAKQKGIEEGKKQAQDDANLTAEQKFAKEKEDFLNLMKGKTIEFNKKLVKSIYKEKGFADDEVEVLLKLVGEDENESVDIANKLCASRAKYEKDYEKKIISNTQKSQQSQNGDGTSTSGEVSFAIKKANEINSKYTNSTDNK